jgi:arsenate reductase
VPDEIVLLHNPRCSKSRAAKEILEERRIAFRERRYLEQPLSRAELGDLARSLGLPARDWVRRGEAAFAAAGLAAGSSDEQILDAMARFPVLLERPVLIVGDKAVVGRPPERILALLPS